jgi:hypothetical protein
VRGLSKPKRRKSLRNSNLMNVVQTYVAYRKIGQAGGEGAFQCKKWSMKHTKKRQHDKFKALVTQNSRKRAVSRIIPVTPEVSPSSHMIGSEPSWSIQLYRYDKPRMTKHTRITNGASLRTLGSLEKPNETLHKLVPKTRNFTLTLSSTLHTPWCTFTKIQQV